jgi:hypothetical protein
MTYKHPLLFKALCYVDGHWVHSNSGHSIAVHNPADQKLIGHVPMLDPPQSSPPSMPRTAPSLIGANKASSFAGRFCGVGRH